MSDSSLRPHSVDHFQAALEASCEALVELELGCSQRNGAGEPRPQPAAEAIELLRRAIGELRTLTGGEGVSVLALGFVMSADQVREESRRRREAQSSRPRTA
jgi:hypothetical protein